LPFEEILEDGIIKMRNHSYMKIIEVKPINYNLKSNLEKEAILNSYKTFLKIYNFDIQIIVQSNKEDLSKNISKIKENLKSETKEILEIANNYIEYIKTLNQKKESSKKKFFILIKNSNQKNQITENNILIELNEMYFKIKESLMRCGNDVFNLDDKEVIIEVLNSFINIKNKGDDNLFSEET
jgi:PHP family Zn ribbon phosphoesterase